MEDKTVNEDTLKFIRHITADGIVEKDEVWDLGRFLGANQAARTSWPGDIIWEILEGVFEDNIVDDAEAADLTRRLRGVEKECHDRNTRDGGAQVDKDEHYETRELSLPGVDLSLEVEAVRPGDPVSQVDLKKQTCTCRDWTEKRKEFAEGSVGRLCRCLATAYERAMNAQPDLYDRLGPDLVNLVRMLSTYGLGGLSETNWCKLEGAGFSLFVSWDNDDDWVAVFAENADGDFERFGYNRKEERWAFGVLPAGAGAVLDFLDEIRRPGADGTTSSGNR